jgi:uncharacterized protein (TIGR02145 family)
MIIKQHFILPFIIVIGIIFSPSATAWYGECGDVDCSGESDIDDVVYLINYIFAGGPGPCDPDDNDLYDCGVCPIGTVTDIDGNLYYTVKIGDQWWMLENLKVAHYRNGDPIPHVTDAGEWEGLSIGAYCEYDNDPTNVGTYGRLYNWHAVSDSRNIAPEGWHVPTDSEWKQLEMFLGMSQAGADGTGWRGTDEGDKLKEAGTTLWNPLDAGATNESGFSGLPGGYCDYSGYFYGIGDYALFWCSTQFDIEFAWYRGLSYGFSWIDRSLNEKTYGFSVRCVRD